MCPCYQTRGTIEQILLEYDGDSRRFKFIVYTDVQGTNTPLVRARSVEACERFIRQARQWNNWDWAIKLIHPTTQSPELHEKLLGMTPDADYGRDVSEFRFINVADITTPIISYTPPDDGTLLEDWADSIFFSGDTAIEVVNTPRLGPLAMLSTPLRCVAI